MRHLLLAAPRIWRGCTACFLLVIIAFASRATPFFSVTGTPGDSTKKDTTKYATYKDLPLKPQRKINFTATEGTWMSVDISPDGKTIAFDLMGDIYTIPASGGKATQVTKGISFDTHPRFSPDGKKLLFTSDRSGPKICGG